jgi:RNA polymerase sigma-70 factor, ECF subfamily
LIEVVHIAARVRRERVKGNRRRRAAQRALTLPGLVRPPIVLLAYSRATVPPSAPGADDALVELVAAASRGGRPAFAELYRRFSRAVHGVVLTRVRYADAADLVQDVFAIALERLPQLAEPAAFPGWLLAIARNRAIDHARSAHVVRSEPTADAADLAGAAETTPGDRADTARVLAALRALPEAYQETLVLRLVEGLSGPEIAAQTGLSPGSVRVNLHRGMKLLRERLGLSSHEAADEAG